MSSYAKYFTFVGAALQFLLKHKYEKPLDIQPDILAIRLYTADPDPVLDYMVLSHLPNQYLLRLNVTDIAQKAAFTLCQYLWEIDETDRTLLYTRINFHREYIRIWLVNTEGGGREFVVKYSQIKCVRG